jgi:hypothetical protein
VLVNWLVISVFKELNTIVVEGVVVGAEEVHGAVSAIVEVATVGLDDASTVVDAAIHV